MGRWMASWQRRMRRRLVSIVGMWSCKVSIISAGHDNLVCFVCLFVCDFFLLFLFISSVCRLGCMVAMYILYITVQQL